MRSAECAKVTGWSSEWGEENSRCRLEADHQGACRPNLRKWRNHLGDSVDSTWSATDVWDALAEIWHELHYSFEKHGNDVEMCAAQEEWIERHIDRFL